MNSIGEVVTERATEAVLLVKLALHRHPILIGNGRGYGGENDNERKEPFPCLSVSFPSKLAYP